MKDNIDLTGKIERLEIRHAEFTPEGETRKIAYRKAYIVCKSGDDEFDIPLTLSKSELKLLELADAV